MDEYLEACEKGDLTQIADAFGRQALHPLRHDPGARSAGQDRRSVKEIHRSNMSKLDDNGQPIYREDGKIMKSNNYFRLDIATILER